jgi:membrane-bound lytic murein transglycosylase B
MILRCLWLAVSLVPAGLHAGVLSPEGTIRYGAILESADPRDLQRDDAAWTAGQIRSKLSGDGALSPALLNEAKRLRNERYALLSAQDRLLINSLLSIRTGAVSVSAFNNSIVIPPRPPVPLAALKQLDFPAFLAEVRGEAAALGVPGPVLDDALTGLTLDNRVLAAESSQPERTVTFEDYLSRVVSDRRVNAGKDKLAQYSGLFGRVEAAYRIPPAMMAAIWGMESNYGQDGGEWRVIRSLATLAYAGKRPSFFRKELLEALRILAEEKISAKDLKGSWAGALGQPQ